MNAPTPDLNAALGFLRWHAPEGPWVITCILPDAKNAPETRTFNATDEQACRVWIDTHNTSWNIYFQVNPLTHDMQKKASRADVARLAMLHLDLDPRATGETDPIKLQEHLTAERSRALNALRNPPAGIPAPSAIIDSGGGYQAYWRLDDGMQIDGDLELCEEAKLYNVSLELAFNADNCHNLDRVMRLPGTINWPDAKKRKKGRTPRLAQAIELTGNAYPLSAFTKAPVDRPPSPSVPKALVRPQDIGDLTELDQWNVDERTRRIITHGHDGEGGSSKTKDTSRSGWVWDAVCQLKRRKVPDDICVGLLINPRWRISESVLEKSNARAYAERQVRNAGIHLSNSWYATNSVHRPTTCYANARISVVRLGIDCAHDVFRDRLIVGGNSIGQHAGELTDHACAALRQIILDNHEYDPSKEHVREAVHALCIENAFDPVREHLAGLVWDGQPRLATWFTRYLGADDTALNAAMGCKTLVAAVKRVLQPGCKFDYVPVLEGAQGTGKSSALRILAGEDEFFSDQDLIHLHVKEQQEALRGKWIFEIAELSGLNRTETERTKAFLTRTHDRARPAYGYMPIDQPRRCIFIGTTNGEDYLKDPTGNRRFWPVATGRIDLAALAADRDQLWAEAVVLERAGELLYLPDDLSALVEAEQRERREDDPWLATLDKVVGKRQSNEERIATTYLLTSVLAIESGRQSRFDLTRLRDCMRRLGWDGPKKIRIEGDSVRGFWRPWDDDERGQSDMPF